MIPSEQISGEITHQFKNIIRTCIFTQYCSIYEKWLEMEDSLLLFVSDVVF